MDDITQGLARQVSEQLPRILEELLQAGHDPATQPLQLNCTLTTVSQAPASTDNRLQVAAVDIGSHLVPFSPPASTLQADPLLASSNGGPSRPPRNTSNSATNLPSQFGSLDQDGSGRPSKRARPNHDMTIASISNPQQSVLVEPARRKRVQSHLAGRPSSFDKFVSGIWDSLYSGVRIDPAETIEQWQAIESSGQPRLLTEAECEVATRDDVSAFGRMNILTRKISQTGKTFRSLEIVVQAHWIQCFDDRVGNLAVSMTREKAKKTAIAEACADFGWSEKELRNKTAIWRGYHDIKNAAGWVGLVFAGSGLYRFVKYRAALTNEAFEKLHTLGHRLEVVADTLHPKWRMLLGIVGASTERKYLGHPHDWVVNAGDEGTPLAPTYYQWDPNFSYKHIDSSIVDEEAWGDYDPRTVIPSTDPAASVCECCGEHQSNDQRNNTCKCYPNLYGSSKPTPVPLQIFRTPDGKNNGLLACCPFEKGWAVGEFVGEITSGLAGLDVMIGETDQCTYQIWQGRQGNHTKFVNHSCAPNAHFERFVWLGKQRIVLASLGIEAGDEVTVDYGDTYWHNLDKECKCGQPCCRYRDRIRRVEAPRDERQDLGRNSDDDDEDETEDGDADE
ncbi:hypothetical protein LTR09_003577 [Extremus antarcticus]|uniref:SET domain-containing protein n=1 Tax=Extremus antarcticus TaxID=702011 RepID=A0AAJ0GDG9_9PEZI|nr:hypothetical protein LTR09_003577 [Extremus antarcticus]